MGGPWPDKCAQWPAGSRRLRPAHKPFRSEKRPGFRQPDAARPLQATRSCRMKTARLGSWLKLDAQNSCHLGGAIAGLRQRLAQNVDVSHIAPAPRFGLDVTMQFGARNPKQSATVGLALCTPVGGEPGHAKNLQTDTRPKA